MVFAAVTMLLGIQAVAADSVDPMATRLDHVIDRAIAEQRLVGAVIIVAKDGKTVYHRAAGFSDREAGRPMDQTAIFRLASMTKPIVSSAVMVLVHQGKLTLYDPVTKWLPNFRPQLPNGQKPIITIAQLLTHTAGLAYHSSPKTGRATKVALDADAPSLSMDERLRRIGSVELLSTPGTQWSYSYAIDVLGAVISKVTGRQFADAVSDLVTKPLSMPDTGFSISDRARLATPYANGYAISPRQSGPVRATESQHIHADGTFGPDDFDLSPSRAFVSESFPSGGGGMVGTAGDYIQFLNGLTNGNGAVFSPDTVELMMSNQIGDITSPVLGPGWGFGYGGAVLIDSKAANTPQAPGTWLWAGAWGNSFFVDRASKISVVALTNTTPEGAEGPFIIELRDAIYGWKGSR
jgi:CubicO group peptidase (beta-lactamase class C family)